MRLSNIFIIIILAFGTFISADAQSFLDQLKKTKQGEGTVTVNQSKEIDDLVNGTTAAVAPSKNNEQPTKANSNTPTKENKQKTTVTTPQKKGAEGKSDTTTETTVDTSNKVIRNGHKITGYRIQVYSGGNSRSDKNKANEIGTRLKSLFPEQPIYVHFYNPRWICRMGNFRTYQEAQAVLKDVKAMGYQQACIVKGKITVQD